MWKPVITASAALAIAGSSLVYAQQRFGGPERAGAERGWRPSAEDRDAFLDARIAALKAGLRLTPEQEKNWAPFEQAVRDMAKLHAERWPVRRGRGMPDALNLPANPFARLEQRADAASRHSAAMKRLAETGTPLFESFDENQKHRFLLLTRMLRPVPFDGVHAHRRNAAFQRDDRQPGRLFEPPWRDRVPHARPGGLPPPGRDFRPQDDMGPIPHNL
jgi:hypothetical protein